MAKLEASAKDKLTKMVASSAKLAKNSSSRKSLQGKKNLSDEAAARLFEQIQKLGRTIQKIPIRIIEINENIRKHYSQKNLETLAASLDQDGLIQFPTLCLKRSSKGPARLICRNGHRRILAAQMLGWESIDCVILSFESASQELYHIINANLNENVFYLDLASAYQEASNLGESDRAIAQRVGVNERTVGWYRRLALMPSRCSELCRQNPEIFNATWAIKLARKGALPKEADLWELMQQCLGEKSRKGASVNTPLRDHGPRRLARQNLRNFVKEMKSEDERDLLSNFLRQLMLGGFLSKTSHEKLLKDFFDSSHESLEKNPHAPKRARRN